MLGAAEKKKHKAHQSLIFFASVCLYSPKIGRQKDQRKENGTHIYIYIQNAAASPPLFWPVFLLMGRVQHASTGSVLRCFGYAIGSYCWTFYSKCSMRLLFQVRSMIFLSFVLYMRSAISSVLRIQVVVHELHTIVSPGVIRASILTACATSHLVSKIAGG